MSAQILSSDLNNLIADSKRKLPDLRHVSEPAHSTNLWMLRSSNFFCEFYVWDGLLTFFQAAEKSLSDLKALPATSEAQLSAGMQFVE